MSFNIIGTGRALPKKCVTNDMLASFLDTSDEWIYTRTGIKERRILTDESLLDLAYECSLAALENAGVAAEELDLIIFSTLQGDYISPSLCCLLSKRLGAVCGRQLDINMGCSGFIYALDIADSYFRADKAQKVLVVCAEAMSRISDWTDRSTCVLFGDGAGAVVLEKGDGFKAINLTVDGAYEDLYVPIPQGNCPYSPHSDEEGFLKMNGQDIYIFAVSAVVREINAILEQEGITPDEPDYYILHQANTRIIDSARKKLKQPAEKFPVNLDRFGNTSSATIPIMLDELNRAGKLKNGGKLIFCSFGAGLTTGVCAIEWTKQ